MKMLFVSAGLHPKHPGGLPAYVEELIDELAQRGHQLVYLDPTGRTIFPTASMRRTGGQVTQIEICNTGINPSFGLGTAQPQREVIATEKVRRLFSQLLETERPDIVHVHEFIGLPLSLRDEVRRRFIPLVFTAHDYFSLCPTVKLFHRGNYLCTLPNEKLDCDLCCADAWTNAEAAAMEIVNLRNRPRLNARLRILVEGTVAPRASREAYVRRRQLFVDALNQFDLIVCMSQIQREQFQRCGIHLDRIEIQQFSRRTFSRHAPQARTQSEPTIFLALNVDSIAKGSAVLIDAFELLHRRGVNVELRMYGKVEGLPKGPLIRHMGPYRPDQLDEICRPAHAGIIASLWWESYAYVGPEMLTRGLPLFVSNRGGMCDYVLDGETGTIFDPDDAAGLADGVQAFVQDTAYRRRLIAGAASAYQRFPSFSDHVSLVEERYRSLISTTANAMRG